MDALFSVTGFIGSIVSLLIAYIQIRIWLHESPNLTVSLLAQIRLIALFGAGFFILHQTSLYLSNRFFFTPNQGAFSERVAALALLLGITFGWLWSLRLSTTGEK